MNTMRNSPNRKIKKQPSRAKGYNKLYKIIIKGISSRLDHTKEQLSKLEDRIVNIIQVEQKKKEIFKMKMIRHTNIKQTFVLSGTRRRREEELR